MKLQQRANPVFEEMIELIVDSATAQRSNAMIHIDIFTEHFLRRPSFQVQQSRAATVTPAAAPCCWLFKLLVCSKCRAG
jgi:hypothetical protein